MGTSDWFKIFGDSKVAVKEKDFKGKCLGVDASGELFRGSLGMKNIQTLTDSEGNPTVLLNVLMCNISRYRKLNIKGLLFVFDNPKPNPHKLKERKKRKEAKEKSIKKLEMKEGNECEIERRRFCITNEMVADVKHMLNLLGVAWIEAPHGYEAEHLGAELTKQGIIDSFMSSDSDTLLFGGTSMIRKVKGEKKYEEYILANVLEKYKLTHDELIHLGVVMGTDFNEKTRGIGVKTILRKGPSVELTDEQKDAKQYFLKTCPFSKDGIHKEKKNTEKFIEWIVKKKNFNEKRVRKILSL
jgi:5'-3' exonuclease